MKIYTKTGDKGETSLFGGGRVKKDHPHVEAYGTVDELNSHVGLLIAHLRTLDFTKEPNFKENILPFLKVMQNRLFDLGAELAAGNEKFREKIQRRVAESDITPMEEAIDLMQEKLTLLKHFILPTGTIAASQAHICRTVARRAERAMVAMGDAPPVLIAFINRVSDYFFVL
ncbi:MAG TPA: cob(I)yrinic acid a,c-diamide adenosyltransferase, partial [Turneriella sp.]|nr:cob(I)yrinic acid a,c-diamide adenosyltransferase [Turneriella sp.]